MIAFATVVRPARPEDDEFLYQVYASTRAAEMTLAHERLGWDAAQQESFLRMQSAAQRQHYLKHYPQATWQVIEVSGRPAGRLVVDRPSHELHLMDVALLPAFRGQGLGTALMQGLQAEAAAAGVPLRLYVESFNPAQRLYRRLGFAEVSRQGIYVEMIWQAGS